MARNPKYQKVHGIILSRKPIKEADLVLTVYTREKGKMRLLGRSMRKSSSKLSGKLQQLYNVELYTAGGGIWPTVTSSVIINKYAKLRKSLAALSMAFYAAELTAKLTPDLEDNPRLYDLLDRYFTELDKHASKLEFSTKDKNWPPLLEKFRLDLLRVIGHGAMIRFCAHCGVKLTTSDPVGFSCFAGGVVHTDCGRNFPDIKPLSEVSVGQLAILDQQALEDVDDLIVGEEAHKHISNFVNFLLERDVNAEKFLDEVREE